MNRENSENNNLAFQTTIQAIKTGGKSAIENLGEKHYPNDFVTFMDQMIHERKLKRKDIIARSGLAEDYAYKLLNGGKKTKERDYIIAICVGAGLSVPQTQHALLCSGMLPLSETDIRSKVIIMGVQRGLSVYHINGHLEEQNLPLIRVASDMPSVRISDAFHWDPVTNSISVVNAPSRPESEENEEDHKYTMGEISVRYSEMKPTDLFANNYTAETVVTDEQGNRYYMESRYDIDKIKVCVYVRTEEQYRRYCQSGNEENDSASSGKEESDCQEFYPALLDATKSPFFACFISMDREVDKQIMRLMENADDTKNYGMRMELYTREFDKTNPATFIEYYNQADPKLKEYFQLIRYADGNTVFTVSHESRYQKMYMGKYYSHIYQRENNDESVFLRADAESVRDLEPRYRYYFLLSRYHLDHFIVDEYNGFGIERDIFIREILEFVKEHARMCFISKEYDEAWQNHLDAERLIGQLDNPKERLILSSLNTKNMLVVSTYLDNTDETEKYEKKLHEIKLEGLKQEKALTPDEQKAIFSPVCFMLYNKYLDADGEGKEEEADQCLREMLDLIENHYAFSDKNDGYRKMYLFVKRAQSIENQDFHLAEEYYRKSLKEMLINHLDNDPDINHITCAIYYNYAKLLQNHIGYQEAIIYYGRALEILEASKYTRHTFTDLELSLIDHIGEKLTGIYEENERALEAERLRKRVAILKTES